MAAIQMIQNQIEAKFNRCADWIEKYTLILEYGRGLAPGPSHLLTDKNKIKGCQSDVWLNIEVKSGIIYFIGDAEALFIKGIIAIFIEAYSGHSAEEIRNSDYDFIHRLGIKKHLGQSRANGLTAIFEKIKQLANEN